MTLRAAVVLALGVVTGCGQCGPRRAVRRANQAAALRGTSTHPPDWMRSASVGGRVRADGKAAPGVDVTLSLLLGETSLGFGRTTTDSTGRYAFGRIPPGAYSLDFRRAGRAALSTTLWVGEGPSEVAVLGLERSAVLSGTVRDDHRRPVAKAQVVAAPGPATPGSRVSTLTDARGRFELDGLHPGEHRVEVSAEGHLMAVEPEVTVPENDLGVRLVRLYRVSGRIEGRGSGSGAVARLAGSGVWPNRTASVTAEGTFVFSRVPAGVYEVVGQTTDPPWAASEVLEGIRVGPEDPAPLSLTLRATQQISGTINAGPRPAAGATLSLGRGTLTALQNQSQADARGHFAFAPVVPGNYELAAWAKGYVPMLGVRIQVPGSSDLKLNLKRGAAVSGTVVDQEGYPIEGVTVWVSYRGKTGAPAEALGALGVTAGPVPPIPAAGARSPVLESVAGIAAPALSGRAGQFTLSGLEPGELRVSAEHPDYASVASPWIHAGADSLHRIRLVLLSGGHLSGRILDDMGRPLEGVEVTLISSDRTRVELSDRGGTYGFRGVSGKAVLTAGRQGYAPTSTTISLAAGQRRELDLVLGRAEGRVFGRVFEAGRVPVAGARVSFRAHPRRGVVVTDSAGYFELPGPGEDPVVLIVVHPGFVPLEPIVVPDREAELHLWPLVGIAGRLEDVQSRQPVRQFVLVLEGGGIRKRVAVKRGDGRFLVSGAPAGPVTLEVDAGGYARKTVRIVVPETTPAQGLALHDIVVSLEPAGSVEGQVTEVSGTPVVGARVRAAGVEGATNEAGEFKLDRVPEGRHEVTVTVRGGQVVRSDPVTVRAREAVGPVRIIVR